MNSLYPQDREDIFSRFRITFMDHRRSLALACRHDPPHTSHIRNTSSRELRLYSRPRFSRRHQQSVILHVISYVLEPHLEFCCGGDSIKAVRGFRHHIHTRINDDNAHAILPVLYVLYITCAKRKLRMSQAMLSYFLQTPSR